MSIIESIFVRPREKNYFDYLNPNEEDRLNGMTFPGEFLPIVDLFSNDCKDSLYKVQISNSRLFINGGSGENINELMLRFGDRRLVVARIEFVNKRVGNMEKLYEKLKGIQKYYSLQPIEMEACETEEMQAWCKKHGFIEKEFNCFVEK